MLLLEFIVAGTPKSVQASAGSKRAWRQRVSAAATAALPPPHLVGTLPVRVTVIYFYVRTDLDLDNILKPILDALNGIAYVDDEQVIDVIAAKRDLSLTYALAGVSPVIVTQLASPGGTASDFVFVRIDAADVGAIP